jgi:hypothetical protein
MSTLNAVPAFGGKRKLPQWYAAIDGIINVLRPHSTLNRICEHLTAQGFATATDLPWNKVRLAAYLKASKIKSTQSKV